MNNNGVLRSYWGKVGGIEHLEEELGSICSSNLYLLHVPFRSGKVHAAAVISTRSLRLLG